MLIIDDNKMKLLKMRRKLLEVSNGNNNRILNDYKDIILDIDNEAYNDLVEEVNNVLYSNLSLEEQIDYFNQIDADYTYLNELQCSFKRIFSKYSGFDIELSDISVIAIDEIRERVSAIQAYLLNCKNLENNRIELEKLNDDFILENKKNSTIIKQINSLEEKTKNDLLLAEGRIQNNNGGMEYTSIQEEFKSFDIDLKKIIVDDSLLHDIYTEAKEEYRDNEEMQEAALICYQNDNNNDDDIYNRIKLNTLKSKYKLILLSIVLEVCTKNDDYSLVKTKVNKIIDLIKQRKKTLQQLNIKHFIDPFDRININNYMEVIKLLDDNTNNMTNLRHTISYFTSLIEEITSENEILLNKINTRIKVIDNNSNINQVNIKELADNSLNSLLLVADEDDKVVNIRDVGNDFLLDRVYEKANGVINRVNQMFTNIPTNDKLEHFQTVPELVIEDVSEDKDDIVDNVVVFNNDNIFEDNKKIDNENINDHDSTTNKNDLFEEILPFTNNLENDEIKVNDTTDEIVFNNDNIFEDNKEKENENINNHDSTTNKNDLFEEILPFTNNLEDNENTYNKKEYDNKDVFEKVVPFESAPLFDDKYDDDIFDNKNDKRKHQKLIDVIKEEDDLEDTMPDIFWNDSNEKTITDNEDDDNDDVLSFDEQVDALIGNTKTKKRVA